MGRLEKEGKHIFWIISLLAFFLVIGVVGHKTGFVIYPGEGLINLNFNNNILPGYNDLMQTYYDYAEWIDFFLFLVIFLGLGKATFGKHFKEGGKAVYTGLGIFLSLALVLWERRNGIFLVEFFGPLVLVFLILLVFFYLYKHLKGVASGWGIFGLSLGYIAFYVLFIWLDIANFSAGYYSSWFYYNIPFDMIPVFTFIFFFLALPGVVIGLLIRRGGS